MRKSAFSTTLRSSALTIVAAAALTALSGTAGAALLLTSTQNASTTVALPPFGMSASLNGFNAAAFGSTTVVGGITTTVVASLNSIHYTLTGYEIAGPGPVLCVHGGAASGTCTGSVTSQIIENLSAFAQNLAVVIPSTSFFFTAIVPSVPFPLAIATASASNCFYNVTVDGSCTQNAALVNLFNNGGAPISFSLTGFGLTTTVFTDGIGYAFRSLYGFGDVSVFYDYTTVTTVVSSPEPMSFAVLGVGLLGLAAARRRKA